MSDPDFNLLFVEGFCEEEPRRCWRTKRMAFGTFQDGLLVKVDPPCSGGDYGLSQVHMPFLLLSPKYQGDSLFPVSKWPEHVYILLPVIDGVEIRDCLALNEVRKIAFGTIYLDNVNARPPMHARYTQPD
jgi:hypothetical protein